MNYHTLSDFRAQAGALLDRLLTESVARLRAQGLVTLQRVAHDGMRVRASAGGGSFRRKETLEHFLDEARAQVAALRRELEEDPAAGAQRRKAARERAAREREERVAEALRQYPDVKKKKKHDKEKARVSVTDPDARKMHMADGGYRPAYNIQFSTDIASQVIVGVEVLNSGSDSDRLEPAARHLQARHHCLPRELLVDGGFVKKEALEKLSAPELDCTVYAPVPAPKTSGRPAGRPFTSETPGVTAWRERMQTAEAQRIYKDRAQAECVNALARNRGLQQFLVRGLKKVCAVVLLYALAHNLLREAKLNAAA
jgi:hypothetical protein